MATLKQIEANRANARKSTGPKTAEGKDASSRNAIRHGLTSTRTLVGNEDRSEYQQLRDKLYAGYAPANPQEEVLVDRLVSAAWRTLRTRQMEQTLANMSIGEWQAKRKHDHPHTAETDTEALVISMVEDDLWRLMHRYDTQISKDFFRTLSALQRLQNDRRKNERADESHQLRMRTAAARAPKPEPQVKTATAAPNWLPFAAYANAAAPDTTKQKKAPTEWTPSSSQPLCKG